MSANPPTTRPPRRAVARASPFAGRIRQVAAGVGVLLLFSLLTFLGYRMAMPAALATLTDFAGHPERDTATTMGQWRRAARGDAFVDNDGARTPPEATANFRLLNGARLKMHPASQVRFARGLRGGSLRIDVELGQVEIQTEQQQVTIGSPFGDIQMQKDTGVLLSRKGEHLHLHVEFGAIQLGQRRFTERQRVVLSLEGLVLDIFPPPSKPSAEPSLPPPSAPPADASATELDLGDGVAAADLTVPAGESFIVHDPTPPTAIGFSFADHCDGPAELRAGKQITQAHSQANLAFPAGSHSYELRCLDRSDVVAARGRFRVLRDAGTRRRPKFAPTAHITADGRRYTVMYQHQLPTVTLQWPTAPDAPGYTLNLDGRALSLEAPRHTFTALRPGRHVLWFEAATEPMRRSRETLVEVVYDSQAPAAQVFTPAAGFEPGAAAVIEGQALPGWSVSVSGRSVPLDAHRQFRVETGGATALPIAFTHPSRNTHYYIRRQRATP